MGYQKLRILIEICEDYSEILKKATIFCQNESKWQSNENLGLSVLPL